MSVSQDTSVPEDRPGCGDRRRLVKTKTPGVFKRIDGHGQIVGYVTVIRVAGKQRKRNARTYEAARRIKRESETDRDRGELQEPTTTAFLRFLDEWVERYRGQGRRGFRENTRDEYRRLIEKYAHPYFSSKLRLVDVTTFQLARFVDWLADEGEQGKRLSDATVANIVIPLRAALTTAKREGLIRHNPGHGLALPHREEIAEEEEEIKVFSREQLAAVLAMAPERHKVLFEVLATCRPADQRGDRAPTPPLCRSTAQSPRSASAARWSRGGSSRRRRSTAGARFGCRRLSSTGCAPIWRRWRTRTPRRWCSRTGRATRSSPATCAAAGSSRWSRRSTLPGRASTRSATRSPRSI